MNPDLEVDADALRTCASALADTGARLTAGAAQPPVPPMVPHWATTDAATLVAEAAQRQLAAIGAALTAATRQITATAADYEAADARAAQRLRATR
jgi:hypothetical protein